MKNKRTFFYLFFLVALISSFYVNKQVEATSVQKNLLIDSSELTVSYDVTEKENQLEWKISYQKHWDMFSKLNFSSENQRVNELNSESIEEVVTQNESQQYSEKKFSLESEDSFTLLTAKEVDHLTLTLQVSQQEEVDGEQVTTENILENSVSLELVFNKQENFGQTNEEEVEVVNEINLAPENLIQANAAVQAVSATSSYLDVFNYFNLDNSPTGQKGIYPINSTNAYLVGNSIKTDTNPTTKNFSYGTSYTGPPATTNILNGTLDFLNGYHTYPFKKEVQSSNVLTKKTVKPTAKADEFDIELDVIGGATETPKKIDVVFVIDKSSSMNSAMGTSTRWAVLNQAMNSFANGLLGQGDIQMGVVSFGSTYTNNTIGALFSDVAKFKEGTNPTSFFTKSPSQVMANTVVNDSPGTGSGTPTFLGVDVGTQVLMDTTMGARADAEKHLIVLTDGLATFGPSVSNYAFSKLTNTDTNANYRRYSTTSRATTKASIGSLLTYGNGTETQGDITAIGTDNGTVVKNFYNTKLKAEDKKYSIGFALSNTSANGLLDIIGPSGRFSADNQSAITNVLEQIKRNILSRTDNFTLGTLTDPMSQYVDYVSNSITSSALLLQEPTSGTKQLIVKNMTDADAPTYASDIGVKVENNQINLDNMNLGSYGTERHGYRINYKVKLKEQYFDGNFYPTNGPTYAAAFNYTSPLGFAVPSVKIISDKVDIPVEKIWNDQTNKWQKRQAIILQLQNRTKDSSETWQNVANQVLTIQPNDTGDKLKTTFKDVLFQLGNKEYEYRVVELVGGNEMNVSGYQSPVYSKNKVNKSDASQGITVTNTLSTLPLTLEKVGHDGVTPLAQVEFTLFNEDTGEQVGSKAISTAAGKVVFDTNLPIGKYILKETGTPDGYQASDDVHFEVKQDNQTKALSFSGITDKQVIVNKLKDFSLLITKEDQYAKSVKGVSFKLSGKSPLSFTKEITQASDNIFTFEGLKPGSYVLEETKTPTGFVTLEKPINLVISELGKVSINEQEIKDVITKEGNLIKLTVTNKAKGILPETGGSGYEAFKKASLAMFIPVLGLSGYYVYRNRKGGHTHAHKKRK